MNAEAIITNMDIYPHYNYKSLAQANVEPNKAIVNSNNTGNDKNSNKKG